MDDDIQNALRIAKSDEPKYDTGPQPGEATMRSYEPTWKEKFQNYLMGTDTAKPSPERRRFAEGMTDIVSSAPGISNVLSGERLAAAMEAEDLPAAGAAALGMIPGASGYVGKKALNVARDRFGNAAITEALRLADRSNYKSGGGPKNKKIKGEITTAPELEQPSRPAPYSRFNDLQQMLKNPPKEEWHHPQDPKYYVTPEEYQKGISEDESGNKYLAFRRGGRARRNGYALGGGPTNLTAGANPAVTTATPQVTPISATPSDGTPFQADLGRPDAAASYYQPFVQNAYQVFMNRAPDAGGQQYWENELQSGNISQKDLLNAFANSAEFQNLYNATPERAISGLYQSALGRAPDQGGLGYWQQQQQKGMSAQDMLNRFTDTQEFRNVYDINNAFMNYQGAMATPDQLASAQRAIASGKTMSDVEGSISSAPEATTNFVKTAYRDMLGRAPDAGGQQYWVNALNSGALDKTGFLNALASSAEGANYANTQTVNQTYQDMMGRAPTPDEIRDPNSLYNDALSKLAAGTLNEKSLIQAISQDPEAVNYQNTQLVNNTFQELAGRAPTQSESDDYASKLAQGSITQEQLAEQINALPDSKNYQEYVNQGLAPQTAAEKAAISTNKDYFRKALDEAGITDPNLRNIMAANAQVETAFANKPEISYANTSNSRIKSLFSAARKLSNGELNYLKKDDKAFFNKIYGYKNGNQGGDDGYNFRGRGAVQLTGRTNYLKYGQLAGLGDSLVKNPDLMNDPAIAAKVSVAFMKDQLDNHPGRTAFDKITKGVNAHGPTVAKKLVAYKQLPKDSEFTLQFGEPAVTPPTPTAPPPTLATPGGIEEVTQSTGETITDGGVGGLGVGAPSTPSMTPISGIGGGMDFSAPSAPPPTYTPPPPHTGISAPISHTPVTHTGGISHSPVHTGTHDSSFGVGYASDPYFGHAGVGGSGHIGGNHHTGGHDPYFGHSSGSYNASWAEQDRNRGMYGTDAELDAMKKRGGRITRGLKAAHRAEGGVVGKALRVAKANGGRLRMADGGASQGDFISQAYQQHLGRAPDAGGQQYWQQQAQSGMGQQAITDAIRLSQEAQQRASKAVSQAYEDYLGRAPDAGGQQYWTNQLQGGALGIGDLGRAFSASPEAQQYAGNLSNAYQLAYGQAPKAAEDAMNWARSYREANPIVLAQDKGFTPPQTYTPDLAAWKPNIPNSNISTPSLNPALDPVRLTPQPSTPSAPSTPTTPSSGDKGTTYDKAVPAWQPNVPASNMETPSIGQQLDPVQKPDIPTWKPNIPTSLMGTPGVGQQLDPAQNALPGWNPNLPVSNMNTPPLTPPLEQLKSNQVQIDPKDYNSFVTGLFGQYLNRAPDQEAQNFFRGHLEFGSTPAEVATAIATSPEAQANQIGSMYQYMLGRDADKGGLQYFKDMINSGKGDLADVGALMMQSPEYQQYQSQLFEANKSGFTPVNQYDFAATALKDGLGETGPMPKGYLDPKVWSPSNGTNDVFPTSFASSILSKGLGPNQQLPAGYIDPSVMLANRNNISDKFQFAVTALQDGLGENGAFKPYVDASINAQKVNDLIGNMDPKDPNNYVTGVYNALTGKNADPSQVASLSQQLTAGTVTPAEVAQQIAKQANVPLPPPRPADLAPQSGAFDTLTNTLSGLASKAGQAISGVGQTLGNLASRVSEAFQPSAGKEFAVTLGSRLAKDYGLTLPQISGILAHFGHESGGFKSNVSEGKPLVAGSRGGYGYGQWTGPRRKALEKFAKNNGLDVSKFDTQYKFMQQEPEFKENLEKVKKAGTMEEAARAFQKYESGGDPRWIANWPSRYIYGRQAQNWMGSEPNPVVAEDKAGVIPAEAEAPAPPDRPEDLSGMITTPPELSPSQVTPGSGISTDISGAPSIGYGVDYAPPGGGSTSTAGDSAPVTHAPVHHAPVHHAPVHHAHVTHTGGTAGHHTSSDPSFGVSFAPDVGGSSHPASGHGAVDPYFGHSGGYHGGMSGHHHNTHHHSNHHSSSGWLGDNNPYVSDDWWKSHMDYGAASFKSGGRVTRAEGGVVDHALRLAAGGGAWTRKEGQNPKGGLNAKGRASAKAEGHNLKPPAPHPKTDKDAARRKSFCSRMQGMKDKLTSSETAKDPDSRINKSLRAWNCREEGGAIKKALDTALETTYPKRLHHTLAETGYAGGGEVWDKPRPKGLGKPKSLSASQKKSAKASAKAAGRPYPSLVDNMRAAQRKK